MAQTIILGAGLTGLSAAYHLQADYCIVEREERAGGLARSMLVEGFVFDHSIHILYSKDPYAATLIRNLLQDNFHTQERSSWVFSKGVFTRYPFQANTYGLPAAVVEECLIGFIKAKYASANGTPRNFLEWTLATFGEGIARHFMVPYNEKNWACDLREMSYDWIAERVPQPQLEEVVRGALQEQTARFGPNALFWYPRAGGIEALPRSFLARVENIITGATVVRILPQHHKLILADGREHHYDFLISTLPLPKLITMVDQVPGDVVQAAASLRYNTVITVNLGIGRDGLSQRHWVYFPEKMFIFHRISFPMNFSPSMAPPGKSSIQAEVAFPGDGPQQGQEEELAATVIKDLCVVGILRTPSEVLFWHTMRLSPAYVIYTHSHRQAVSTIHAYLHSLDIYPCGRFGEWEYLNMDHSILSGKKAAESIKQKVHGGRRWV